MTRSELSPSSSSSSEAYLAAPASPPSSTEDRLQNAVRELISQTGEHDLAREGLRATPLRVAKAWREATQGQKHDVRSALGGGLFQEEIVNRGSGGLVLVRDIDFATTSEHTLLPFFGKCHVGYYPSSGVVLGLSKAARLAKHFSRKLQSQQQFTQDLLTCLIHHLHPFGAVVCVVAQHLGSSQAPGVQITTAGSGAFSAPQSSNMQEFLCILRLNGCIPSSVSGASQPHLSTPARSVGMNRVVFRNGKGGTVRLPDSVPQNCDMTEADPAVVRHQRMGHAVETILLELGENPLRQGLAGSVNRYVNFMREATAGYEQQLSVAQSVAAALSTQPAIPHPSILLSTSSAMPQVMSTHFSSLCEHHLLPFQGTLRVAMCPAKGPTWQGIQSVAQQLVSCYSRRLQIQERLTHEVANALVPFAHLGSLLVVCDAVHMCMVARGVEQHASSTMTVVARGQYETDADLRAAALQQLLGSARTA